MSCRFVRDWYVSFPGPGMKGRRVWSPDAPWEPGRSEAGPGPASVVLNSEGMASAADVGRPGPALQGWGSTGTRTPSEAEVVSHRFAELAYFGQWFTPLLESLSAFVAQTQERVTGTVRVKLYKGNCTVVGRKSPFSLYREDFAPFGKDDVYDQRDAEGFINLFGLPLKVKALVDQQNGRLAELEAPDYSLFKRD